MRGKRLFGFLIVAICTVLVCVGCGRNSKINGTYIHEADDTFGEFIIVHNGNDVTVTINGEDHSAKMESENNILVDDEYTILETYGDKDGNPGLDNVAQDDILVPHAKDWIEGDYEVDDEGALHLVLIKQ